MNLAVENSGADLATRIAVKHATPPLGVLPGSPAGARAVGRPKPSPWRATGAPACLLVLTLGILLGLGPAPAALPVVWGATQPVQEDNLYIVHLKNGKQLRASRYWEVGGDYRFELFGGVVGLEKGDVARIEVIQRGIAPAPEKTPAPPITVSAPDAAPTGVFSQLTSYVSELMEWVRGWMSRLWSPRRPVGEGLQAPEARLAARGAARGGPGARGGSLARTPSPPPFVVLVVVIALIPPIFLGGRLLGGWLAGHRRP